MLLCSASGIFVTCCCLTWTTIMRRARTYRWTRMRPYRTRFREQGVFFAFQSWAGCITNMFGFDLRQAQLKLLRKLLKKMAFVPDKLVTDDLRSYGAAARELGLSRRHERGRWRNN